ncbi:hypothetical protein PENARI_c015G02733 [Penicillium arizonense]|uniref:BZIP domain-containing protein n=1 Tax=Penicillium arizonense TaxID=1835702 RepID=A0A1F5LCV6_PENAI|nr:hypothetical protein PENARI_c015G02733 [Penicillium arizonense]OGE50886.1 hypothetical protein PENARI_c015G02733 [Penicillium arizonense]
MARYFQSDFYQQSPTLEVTEEDEMSVLDDKILEPSSEDLSDRRASYDAPDAYSHRDSVWSNYSHTSNQSRSNSHLGHSMLNSTGASFMPVDGPHSASYQSSWSMPRPDSGSCTPTAGYDQYPAEAEQSSSAPFAGGAVGPVSAIPMNPMSYRGSMSFAPGSVAMSPQSSQGWMPAPMDLADAPSHSTKSPTYRHDSPLTVRRDGIRKKNARFEIPAERTLSNIDYLISQSNNEDEIKELKQQKRLLRNRQAALDSRQRKKLHTEKLEEEKKHFTATIGDLEEALQSMKMREAELLREKSEWIVTHQQMNQYIEGLHMEKDEVIRVHTLETAELRKKNNILMETVDKLERGVNVKPVPEATPGDFTGFENLTMDTHWDDFAMTTGVPMQQDHLQARTHAVNVSQQMQPKAPEKSTGDLPISWNAFYMCLLFGAFIASNSTSIPGRSLPQLSEEYRAESANVLKAVLASSPGQDLTHAAHATASGPNPATISGMEMGQMGAQHQQVGPSALDQLHDTLVMPTEQQEREQVFALNADQYNSLTTFEDDGAGFKPQQPSSLQQALAAMRNSAAQQSRLHAVPSDVYSRSLMWDRVPDKVIRDFRRMVQDYATPVKEEGIFHA